MREYENYTLAPVPWIEKMPLHWKLVRGKHLYQKMQRPTSNIDEVVTCFRDGTVTLRKNRRITGFTESLKEIGYQGIKKGDLVIHVMDAFAGSIGVSDSDGKGTPVYNVCQAKGDSNNQYYALLLREMARTGFIQSLYRGIRERSSDFRFEVFAAQFYPVPPSPEQDQIVRFLDWKVSSINKLISVKRKQIALLHERQSVHISHIVTHGLGDGVAAKNSGAEWLGDIPEHWQAMRCKYLFSEREERSQDGLEQHLSMSQKYGLVPDSQLDERRMLSESYVGGKLCDKDDLVLNRLKAHLGVFALAPQSGVISPDYTVLRPNTERILPSFAETVLKSDCCRGELRIRVRGIIEGFWRLYTDDFNTIVLPVPPLDEQAEIMEYIVEFRDKAKKYEDTLTQEISSLQELKARLISDTVTGKIDVRGIQIPEYEFAEENIDTENDESMEGMKSETYEE